MSKNIYMHALLAHILAMILLHSVYAISDSNLSNNNMSTFVNVTSAKPLVISFVHYAIDANDQMNDYESQVNSQIDFIRRVYPIQDINPFIIYDESLLLGDSLRTFVSQDFPHRSQFLLRDLESKLLIAEINHTQKIVGLISENFAPTLNGFTLGFSHPNFKHAVVVRKDTVDEDTTTTSTHEIGHTFDLCDEYKNSTGGFEWDRQNSLAGETNLCPNADKNNDEQFDEECKNPFGSATGCPVENQQLIIDLFFNGQGVTNLINMYGSRFTQDLGPYRRWVNKETVRIPRTRHPFIL
ncbi:MAG: hypothetical protein HYS80_02745 [Candidatus Aenigmarchaeota archaeon]|nr:hypothetical protein [Candidatus Aenigmarchaeota archaeon]